MKQLTHGSLFAGIGGFDLGFERAGIKTIWQVEIDEYCRRVLARHFPDAERYSDVRECGINNLKRVDIICGGFPCQDISAAGSRIGINGERSGLWREMARILGELSPQFVAIENVPDLLTNGMPRVIGDLSAIGYDAEWQVIPACAIGSPHIRERIWIIAYPTEFTRLYESRNGHLRPILDGDSLRSFAMAARWPAAPNPPFCGVDDGIPERVDAHEGLGNALVPQIAEWIGRRIVEASAVCDPAHAGGMK